MTEWISVEDRLPCEGTRVLFCCEQEIDIGYFFEELGWKFLDGGDWFEIKNPITHWMPLPLPPKDEISEKSTFRSIPKRFDIRIT